METVFYDGHCGLCHRTVKFVLARDRHGWFRFAPLQGPTFEQAVPEAERTGLPDSLVVQTVGRVLLVRSDATLHILRQLGGVWRVVSILGHLVPRPLRDLVYDAVARVRKRIFKAPVDACPIIPRELRPRFDP